MPHKVLITAPYLLPFVEEYRPLLESQGCELIVAEVEERLSETELLPWVLDIEGAICGDDQWTDQVMAAAPQLKVLSKWGTGIDSIDQEAAKKRGIAIRNVPNAFSEPLADTIFGWMLWFARRLPEQVAMMRAGGWEKIPGQTLGESTLGVIGVGNVGKAVIRRARAFNMTILGTDITKVDEDFIKQHEVQMVSLEELLSRSDYVSLNCDLNPTSRYLIRSETLVLMKPSAVLMNSARGPVVKEADLIDHLQLEKLHGAALDVFEQEPLANDSPLRAMDNVILSAHNSNSSPEAWGNVHRRAIDNMMRVLDG